MHQFLGVPTRGGKLTILNCLLWVIVAIGIETKNPVLILPAIIACWPVAWLFLLGFDGAPAHVMVLICVMIGVNSLLWGYGIAWLQSQFDARRRRRSGPGSAIRGFEVITSAAPQEPAAGENDVHQDC
jgi:hypothetical protein